MCECENPQLAVYQCVYVYDFNISKSGLLLKENLCQGSISFLTV